MNNHCFLAIFLCFKQLEFLKNVFQWMYFAQIELDISYMSLICIYFKNYTPHFVFFYRNLVCKHI